MSDPSPWFFAPRLDFSGPIELDPGESAHLARVLRLTKGDPITLFDGEGRTRSAVVASASPKSTLCSAEGPTRSHAPRPALVLAVPAPKGPRADAMVDMLAQLGASAWVPLQTERTVVLPGDNKIDKWRSAARQACKQCQDPWAMRIDGLTPMHAVLDAGWPGPVGLPAEASRWIADTPSDAPADSALAGSEGVTRVTPGGAGLVLIGPEGGWTEAERYAARSAGFTPLALGPNVLRIETAAVCAAALWRCGST
ncbi:MAG: 16S rRNA (uracil(1498)-N(3))-methyltransferase [Planctomycetota bacterium]